MAHQLSHLPRSAHLSGQMQMGAHCQLQVWENPLTMELQLNLYNFTNDNINPPNNNVPSQQ